MFTHKTHLRHLLRPEQYVSEHQYRLELRSLFQSAWHPLVARGEIARPGDYRTFDLLDVPILLRNCDGELRAFLNVCPHRHSKMVGSRCGNADSIKCQYHGWEFNKDGRTGKVPDARAFRPWDRDNACLQRIRVEICGELVFVNLSDRGPTLRDWFGENWDTWSTSFGGAYRLAAVWEQEFPCNWKVVLENSLESYHIPQVHPKTFKVYPEEENAWHEMTETYSSFKTIPPDEFATRIQNWIVRRLGEPIGNEYWHRVRHPHTTFSSLDSFRMIQCVFPTGPTTCRYRSILFTLRGRRRNPFAWTLYRMLRAVTTVIAKKVFAEDASIYESVQSGLSASPHAGVIGTREERIFAFQEYVNHMCSGPMELPQLHNHANSDVGSFPSLTNH
jgi:phenylpropionate dioxygenase-like ring-hydroxylating dioxygenase large terminal subunit